MPRVRPFPHDAFPAPIAGVLAVLAWSLLAALAPAAARAIPAPATAQASPEPPSSAPTVRAVRAETEPVVDGNVMEDPAWEAAEPLTEFWQTRPDEGRPASEETRVWILYTRETLYVGVVCHDRSPGEIIVADSRRDAPLEETDSFRFVLDTFRDRQNGFVFGTNAVGVEYDAQVSNDGEGTGGRGGGPRAQGGSGGGLNVNWDGSWTVRARTGDHGWSAEFAIPFRTLRFEGGEARTWGINFERTIRRRRERAYWAPLPRQYDLPRVSRAGTLTGLDVPSPRNLQLVPYVLAQGAREDGPEGWEMADPEADFGADLKYGITPALTLDVTYNTDFAQVEVDEQQINLDRFNLFFPEKRPFFLENAGIFSVGQPGEVELFFSRRIGIGPDGEEVPILGGARLSGDLAGMKVGVLTMQTEEVGDAGIPSHNFAVARLRRELPNRSFVGGLFTNREAVGELAGEGDYNRVLAVDGQLGIGRYGRLSGFAARSFTPDRPEDEHALHLQAGYDSEGWNLEAEYTELGEGFVPEVGFLQRSSYRKARGLIFRRIRPDFLGFHEIRPHARYTGYWGFDGFHESGFLHVDSHWEWESGYEIHTGLNLTHEGVREPFELLDGVVVPAGSYDHREVALVGNTDESEWISLSVRLTAGGFFGGDRVSLSPTLKVRPGEAFNSELSLQRNDIDLPGGSVTTHLLQARLSYSFDPRLYVQTLVQYNDAADVWSTNLRLGWLQAAGTGLFVVLNQTDDFGRADDLGRALDAEAGSQTLIVKYSRLINLLN